MIEAHVYEELSSIVMNGPLFPGDSLSHATLNECVRRGWAERVPESGCVIARAAGHTALSEWMQDNWKE